MNRELIFLISSLSEDNFRKLIQEYLKEKYKTPNVRITDGPYDGGNDLEVIVRDKDIKRNIQVTVQKIGYEKKLDSDLQKASENIQKYNYLNNLDFYISHNITKEKRNQLEDKAEVDYGINLRVIDANILSQAATQYSSIRDFTYEAHKIKLNQNQNPNQKVDKQTKILFDVLTLNKNSIEIKKNFINSYIYSFLYVHPNSSSEEIFEYINPQLNETLDEDFIKKELNLLRSKQHIESKLDKSRYQLTENRRLEIEDIYSTVTEQENELEDIINSFISEHAVPCDSQELTSILLKLYQENYTIDIEEINKTNNSFSASIKKMLNDLTTFFIRKGVKKEIASVISKTLIKICESNDFLNKLSSIHLFTNLYSSNKLEKYINSKKQRVFLDTQVLIRLICVLYNERVEYSDIAMQSSKILLMTLDRYKDRVHLYSSYDYIDEVAGHLLEAYKLKRFLSLPFISKLGKSKNVFYNTYVELIKQEILEQDTEFISFIEEVIGEEIAFSGDKEFLEIAKKKIEDIFEQIGIELIYHPNYPNYAPIKKEYEISLAYQSKERSYTARENDLRTILYLSQKENNIDAETDEINEPFLITWDSAFYSFRKELLKNHKEFTYWYIYSPLKLVDRLSVMNFNVKPESISLNIIALTETNFNYSAKTVSFIDVISTFFNTEDVHKLGIIHRLASLKKSTEELDEIPNNEIADSERETEIITNLLLEIKSHYDSYKVKYKFYDIIKVFENISLEDKIVQILETNLKNRNTKLMFDSFDELIKAEEVRNI